jgi:hypothetical protein
VDVGLDHQPGGAADIPGDETTGLLGVDLDDAEF